jgi:hypothetical protein
VELINPWRYWTLIKRSDTIEKQVSVDDTSGRRVLSVVGDYGQGSNLSYTFFNHGKIEPGRYRFSCRVKGTAGLSVQFDVADSWRGVIDGATMPLSPEWRAHEFEFDVEVTFQNETRLRFGLPPVARGEFHLTDPHLRRID